MSYLFVVGVGSPRWSFRAFCACELVRGFNFEMQLKVVFFLCSPPPSEYVFVWNAPMIDLAAKIAAQICGGAEHRPAAISSSFVFCWREEHRFGVARHLDVHVRS
jgi:hypothetical protein